MMFQNRTFFCYFVINFLTNITFGKTFATTIIVRQVTNFYKTKFYTTHEKGVFTFRSSFSIQRS